MASIQPDLDPALVATARRARRVTVLTGAGMSAESGIATFRDAQTGLWARFDPTELASPEGWARDRALVWAWYQWRTAQVRRVQPNAGHRALARWAESAELTVITQNVDDLHERAGSTVAAHLHGSLLAPRCSACEHPAEVAVDAELAAEPVEHIEPPGCAACGGPVRPGVVWFGEALPEDGWATALAAADDCDLMVVVGTSAVVYPAAELPLRAARSGATVVEVNPEQTGVSGAVHHVLRDTAARALPALVEATCGPRSGASTT